MKSKSKTNLQNSRGLLGDTIQAGKKTQCCPNCNQLMGIMPGSRDAVCKNCGYKDPCCE